MYDTAANLSKKGQDALKKEEYYAAASYCFGSNVRYNQVFLETKNFSEKKYRGLLDELSRNIESYEKEIDSKQIKTITDLESYMVTKERLIDAQSYTNSTLNGSLSYAYAYASERYISAQSWAEFFTHEGKVLEFNDATLKDSCQQRISEAEERLQYAALYIPFSLSSPRKELDNAYSDFSAQNYALCLFKASQAKAEVNIILNTLGVEAEYIPTLIDNKLAAAARVIRKGEKNGMFPILGYSYYEYANNLKDSDKFSSLLYSEYALELSNLDMYFKEEKRPKIKVDFSRVAFASTFLLVGAFLGAYIMAISIKKTIKTTISKKDDYKPSKTRSLAGKKR
jgi:predicted S18 family serine protease